MNRVPHLVLAGLLLCLPAAPVAAAAPDAGPPVGPAGTPPDTAFDLLIRGGRVIDGTGSPWYRADVAVRDGRIAAIGRLPGAHARREIDARGMVVAPGFIDMLGQSELTILVDPRLPSKIYQGITTEATGEGTSPAPLDSAMVAEDRALYEHYGITPDWRTLAEYFARLERRGIGINLASYVGATSVRERVLGREDRAPTPAELRRMEALVARAMEAGALGVSTALEYAPAPYASTEELVALARVAARYGGLYATHMRSEGDDEMAALDETFRIGREAGLPIEIWHLKVAGVHNWGGMPRVVARIDSARNAGLDVEADTYAYTAWANSLSAFVPPWAHDGGTDSLLARLRRPATRDSIRRDMTDPSTPWDDEWLEIPDPHAVLVTSVLDPDLRDLQGLRLDAIADRWGEDPIDAIFDLLLKDRAATGVAVFAMSEGDVRDALAQPWVSVDTDYEGLATSGVLGGEHPHPRAYATFPRILRKYVREEGLFSLEEAVRKFSALPAQRLGLTDRGVLREGLWADIVVFDPDTIRDVATFEDPNRLSEGMRWVLVNGVPVIADGAMTGATPGKVLRGPGWTGRR